MKQQTAKMGQSALVAVASTALVLGMVPMAWAATTNTSNTNTQASSAASTTTNTATNTTTSATSSASSTSATNTSTVATEDDATTEDAESEETEEETDPYESTYEVSAADAGESRGTLDWVTGTTPADTALLQIRASFTESAYAVVVSAESGAETLCASALAGAYDAPLFFTINGGLDEDTVDLMDELGVEQVIVVGDKKTNLSGVGASLSEFDPENIVYLRGENAEETSLEVLRYGQNLHLWNLSAVTLANSADTQTANALGAYAYREAQPVLLTTSAGKLTKSQIKMVTDMRQPYMKYLANIVVAATVGSVQSSAVDTLDLICKENAHRGNVVYLTGETPADVAAAAESLWVEKHDIDWESAVVANVSQSSCTTAGIMAARLDSTIVATDGDSLTGYAARLAEEQVEYTTISGEGSVVENWTLNALYGRLGFYEVNTYDAGITISDLANIEVDAAMDSDGNPTKTKDEILEAMDPGRNSRGEAGYFEFAELGEGYSGVVTAEQIDGFINSIVGPYESSYGCTSVMRGKGAAFVEAAKESGLNEVYLLAHAIVESACGCSQLARGTVSGSPNLFGIGAYDSNPDNGASLAASEGWDDADTAIIGGAKWIASNYVFSSTAQRTLYQMRWNAPTSSHKYATSLTWTNSIATLMSRFYSYAGIELENTGLDFSVIEY